MQRNGPIVSIADEIVENALVNEGFVDQSAEIEVLRGVKDEYRERFAWSPESVAGVRPNRLIDMRFWGTDHFGIVLGSLAVAAADWAAVVWAVQAVVGYFVSRSLARFGRRSRSVLVAYVAFDVVRFDLFGLLTWARGCVVFPRRLALVMWQISALEALVRWGTHRFGWAVFRDVLMIFEAFWILSRAFI